MPANNVRYYRLTAGLTLEQLANAAEIGQVCMLGIENGEPIHDETLLTLAVLLEVTPEELMRRERPTNPRPPTDPHEGTISSLESKERLP